MELLHQFFTLNLTSLWFFAVIAAIALVYYAVPLRARWCVILCANVLFVYSVSGATCLFVMAAMFFFTWIAALLFEVFSEKPDVKKQVLFLAVFVNAGLLVLFKDAVFFTNLFHISKEKARIAFLQSLAPVGMSYWTLNIISYIFDCYKGTVKGQNNFAKFCTYAGFFPLLVSGPIVRYGKTASQILEGHRFNYEKFCGGVQRILWGVFKKLIIAERVATIVNTVYGNSDAYRGLYIWFATVMFVLQLYADFSGCIDIVLGASELFGIDLPENFNLPFLATSISEYWRRWHITLGFWLRDYVFFPLFGNLWKKIGGFCKKRFPGDYAKKVPSWMVLSVSWFIIGFWHGGAWRFIVGSGFLMWTTIVAGELFEPLLKKIIAFLKINTECFSWKLFQRFRTFCIVTLSLLFFRSYDGFKTALKTLKSAVTLWNPWIFFDGSLYKLGLDYKEFHVLIFALAILFAATYVKAKTGRPVHEAIAKQNVAARWILWIGMFAFVLVYGMYGEGYNPADFLYGGF